MLNLGLIGFVAIVAASYLITYRHVRALRRFLAHARASTGDAGRRPGWIGVGLPVRSGFVYRATRSCSLLKTPRDVGTTPSRTASSIGFLLPGIFIATVFPIMTRTLHTDKAAAQRVINRVFEFLVLAGIATTLFVYTLAPFLVQLVAGDEFRAAVHPLRILALAITMLFATPVFYNVLLARDWQRDLVVIGILLLIWDVSTNLVLIPRYGYNGAAVATIGTQTFALLILFVAARRREPFRIDVTFLARAMSATAPAVLVVYLLRSQSQWEAFVAAEVAFGAAAILLGAVKRADLRRLIARASG